MTIFRTRNAYTLFFLIALFLFPGRIVSLHSQDQIVDGVRVAVLPLWYDADLGVGENLSDTVQTTIQWTIRFIQGYELIEPEEYPTGQMDLAAFVKKYQLNNVIYGRVSYAAGTYSISLLLYDSRTDQIVEILQDTVTSVLDIFDLADSLSLGILERFIGRSLVFGSVGFQDTGDGPGDYEVYINDTSLGINPQGIPRFLTGNYRFRVNQLHEKDVIPLFDEIVEVKENTRATIQFRSFPYGKVTVRQKGPSEEFRLFENDGEFLLEDLSRQMIREAGTYSYRLEQTDPLGEIRVMDEFVLALNQGDYAEVILSTQTLTPGFRFVSAAESPEGEYQVFLDGEYQGDNLEEIPVLPKGAYTVTIQQIQGEDAWPVWKESLRTNRDEPVTVTFPLYGNREAYQYYLDTKPDFSLEFQLFSTAWGYGGIHWETLSRYLGLTALTGFYMLEADPHVVIETKAHWLPLRGSARFAPYAGVALYADAGSDQFAVYAGPQIGISWNTGLPILSALYFDNGLFYKFGDTFRMAYRFGAGVRLY